jgi:uncharacterized coiled-coil protein SlyX
LEQSNGFITLGEAASRLGVTEDAIRKRLRTGSIKGKKIEKRWMVDPESLRKSSGNPLGTPPVDRDPLMRRFQDELSFVHAQIAIKDQQLAEKDKQLREQLTVKDRQITELNQLLAKLNEDIESWREQVRYKELQIAQLQDRMIQLPSIEEPEPTKRESEVPEPAVAQEVSGNVLSQFWRWFVGGD